MHFLSNYGLFLLKTVTLIVGFLILLTAIIAIATKNKFKETNRLEIKKLNDKYAEMKAQLQTEILAKASYKQLKKAEKQKAKAEKETERKKVFVLDFNGDLKASQVHGFREMVTALLLVATPKDEVLLRLESPGGIVSSYGLAASQVQRIRDAGIPLIVTVDNIAASGGYLMACVANKILAAPFAIIGSIGVVATRPNFNRLLKKHDVDYEQITAGEYKRTLTLFGEITDQARHKVKEDVEQIHGYFKEFIQRYRSQVPIEQVATGEYWLASKAIEYKLVDELITSDDFLLKAHDHADIYSIQYLTKKNLVEKLTESMQAGLTKMIGLSKSYF